MVSKKGAEVIDEVKKILEEYPDIKDWSLRQMYYRLVARLVLENTINNYKNLSRWLVEAREEGWIDYNLFEDRARKIVGTGDRIYETPECFIERRLRNFRNGWKYFAYPQWYDQEIYIEVWLEKDALSKIFSSVTDKYKVYTCPSRGYPSFSYVMDAVKRFERKDKPIKILYFGDFDPTGLNIPENLLQRFKSYGEYEHGIELESIALNIDQIRQYNLPPAPAKKSDTRYNSFVEETGSDRVVELDALEPTVLQDLIKEALEEHIDADLWNKTVERSEKMQQKLKPLLEEVKIEFDEELLEDLFEEEEGE